MTVKQLISEIHRLYVQARYPIFKNQKLIHKRILRGESRSISSEVEDLFAKYLIELVPKDTILLINQTITTGSKSNRIRVKPDIVVVRNNEIKAIIDLKMDLGYNRKEFPIFWKFRDSLIPKMRGKRFSLYKKTELGEKTHLELKFSKRAKLFFVIITDTNINYEDLSAIKKYKGKKKYSDTYFLLEGIHPNDREVTLKLLFKKINAISVTLTKFTKALKAII